MKASEWLEIAAVIRERWPHAQLPDESIQRWGEDVADLPAEHVAAALEALYRQGREFPPNGGQLRAHAVELQLAPPEFAFVVRRLRHVASRSEELIVLDDAGHEVRTEPRAQALREEHPLIREFVRAVGWGQIRGLDGGAEEARLREKWQAHVARARREVLLTGIPSGGLRELRRIEAGQARRLGDAVHEVKGELEAA